MSQNFSWQTDEDSHWDDPIPGLPPSPRPKRRWQWLLVFAAAALLISTVIYARLQEQVKEATAQAEQDVLAAHQLSQHAAASNDLDLFRSNLSRRDPNWADAQRELITEGLFLDRSAFGLRWWGETGITLTDAAATPTLPITITLSPDLLSAEVVYEQEYLLTGSATTSETIRLQQTAVYRRGGGRWLRADPLDDFWGETEELEQSYLTLLFNQRDQVIATRLAQDLNQQLQVMCETFPDLTCSDDFHLRLLLTRNPERFFTLQNLETIITTEDRLSLPSPTLVGLPLDEAGYQIILKGYAVPLVSLAITRLTGYQCCEHGLFFRAFLEKELSVLGLQPWSLTTEQYTQLTLTELPNAVTSYWSRERFDYDGYDNLYYLYSLVDFLARHYPEADLSLWQRGLHRGYTYWEWLESVLGGINSQVMFYTEWMQFVQQQRSAAAATLSLPTGELQLVCNTNEGTLNVYNYHPQTDEWGITFLDTREPSTFGPRVTTNVFQAIPGGSIIEQIIGTERVLVMLRDGLLVDVARDPMNEVMYTTSYPYLRLLGGKMPDNYFHFQSYNNQDSENLQNWLVNLDDCANGNCQPQPIAGMPIWSPDGQFMLLYDDYFTDEAQGNINIRLADREGRVINEVGLGQMPFWIDDSHFGYLQIQLTDGEYNSTTDLYVGQIADGLAPRLLLTHEQMMGLLPEDAGDTPYYMIWATARPGDNHNLSLLILPNGGDVPRYFVLDLVWNESWQSLTSVEVVWDKDSMALPTYSADGLFEVFINLGGGSLEPQSVLAFLNRETGVMQTTSMTIGENYYLSIPVWSEDGQWLINVSDAEVLLVNPYMGVEWRTPHAFGICNQIFYTPVE